MALPVAVNTLLAPLISGLLVEHVSGRVAPAAFAGTLGIAAIMCVTLPGLDAR